MLNLQMVKHPLFTFTKHKKKKKHQQTIILRHTLSDVRLIVSYSMLFSNCGKFLSDIIHTSWYIIWIHTLFHLFM